MLQAMTKTKAARVTLLSDLAQTRLLSGALATAGLALFVWKAIGYGVPVLPGAMPGEPLPAALDPLATLPADVRETFRIMVLVPVGILLLVFLRQFIGVATIGTFMPVLIGVSFRETGVVVGAAVFTFLVVIGMLVRMYFEQLRLLLVPRLAAVIVVVVICIMLLAVVLARMNIDIGSSASLFPLVILAMTIERMAIAWEELSPREAMLKGIGSLVIAVLSHVLMTNDYLEHLFFRFPELLLVVLSVMLLAGKYTGYRLSELIRFREITRP